MKAWLVGAAVLAAVAACTDEGLVDQYLENYDFQQQKWVPLDVGVEDNLQAIQLVDANTGFIVGDAGVVLKTSDGGATWASTYPVAMTGQKLRAVSFTSPAQGVVASTLNLYSTQDGGHTWSVLLKFSDTYKEQIQGMRFITAGVGYVLTDKHVYQTLDGGKTFTDTQLVNVHHIEPTGSNLYAAGANIYRGEVGGAWTGLLSADKACASCSSWPSFISASEGWAVFAGKGAYGEDSSRLTVLKTADGGATWTNLPIQNYEGKPLAQSLAGVSYDTIRQLRFADANHGWMLYGGCLLATRDGGQTWVWQDQGFIDRIGQKFSKYMMEVPLNISGNDLAVIDAANAWVVGNGGLLYHYTGEDFPAFHQK